jgi:uncharacterized membrane protein
MSEKIMLLFFTLFTFIIDIIWYSFWNYRWSHLKNDVEGGLHSFILILTIIGMIVKIISIAFIFLTEWNSIKASLPTQLRERLNKNYAPQEDEI